MRIRLTDQAAAAVAVARMLARDRPATAAHVLVGLVVESEGRAGLRLRERASAAAVVVDRGPGVPSTPADDVLRSAAAAAGNRPVSTVDLLDAVVTAGGPDVADLLQSAGYHRDLDGYHWGDRWWDDVGAETYGLGAGQGFDPDAARAVAAVRAVAGGAVQLLLAVVASPASPLAESDPNHLFAASERLAAAGAAGAADWDRGVDVAVDAARTLAGEATVTLQHLLHATLVAGGAGPLAILEEARRDE